MNVIPKPVRFERGAGAFEITPTTRISHSENVEGVGNYLQGLLRPATGFSLRCSPATIREPDPNTILLTTCGTDPDLGDEGYQLTVAPESIVVKGATPAGLFYGVQTLRQILPAEVENPGPVRDVRWTVPAVVIQDKPRFIWRATHLDVGRHLFTVESLKRYLDLMALHKLNVFHWHLTEDQRWRIEIRKYSRLTQVGSKRSATPVLSNREIPDGTPYEGYYTQEEIREVVAHAASRFITVVPEIEMPGHSVAALASYPELGCTGGPYAVRTRWGIAKDVFCAGNEQVFAFLKDVLTEVMALFPSEFIHVGGDECPKDRWRVCPQCQAAIRKHGLKDEDELQSHFIRRIEAFLNSRGRRLLGWDEILEGGLAPNATVMSWRGMAGGIEAARCGHDVVMSPMSHCYFDYCQSRDFKSEPPSQKRFLTLETVYSFEPIPVDLLPEEAVHILGAQGILWTEFIPTAKHLEYMAFPRASALAEVVWSPKDSRDYQDFLVRLRVLLDRLNGMGVNYRDPLAETSPTQKATHWSSVCK